MVAAAGSLLGSGREQLDLPSEPRVVVPPDLGAVLAAEKLLASGSYWDETGARFVFVEPEKVRVFKPVELEVPTVEPPKIVMPLPDPGPLLRHSDSLPRLDGSLPDGAPVEGEAAPPPADDADDEKAGGGE